jgi:streptogramin lyase
MLSSHMKYSLASALTLTLLGFGATVSPANAQTIVTIGSGLGKPYGVAVDGGGDVFVADTFNNAVKEIVAAGGYAMVNTLGSGFSNPFGIAVDGKGNVFVADYGNNAVKEILAAGGYVTVKTLGGGFSTPSGVAVDGSGNVFVADTGNKAVKEILAAGGYVTVNTLGSGFSSPEGVAVDGSGNLFVTDTDNHNVRELLAAGGYTTVKTLGSGYSGPSGVAADSSGNVFVADGDDPKLQEIVAASGYTSVEILRGDFASLLAVAVDGGGNVFVTDYGQASTVREILATPPALVASVLPGSRSVQLGHPATIFASLINTGGTALDNCGIGLSSPAPSGLTLSYQTTDPATNALSGTPNKPVTIPGGNGSQSFLISFQGTAAFDAPAIPLEFACFGATVENMTAVVSGVDTVDLSMSATPVADIIALAATVTNNGITEVPKGGAAAFAVASTNIGVTTPITVSVDTGAATLPVTTSICQTNPANGQCLAPPAASVTLSYAGGAAPTFSIFLQSTGAIAFAPATSRVFVRFKDGSGGFHGSTSVAIETL